ncbi:peptidylprolyl isomerase [Rubrivivax albus]|uniref:Chaperone SurA n=1 Tax=Rubrivivax albus TaxID=2499835 RepID=A0A3S2X2E2_9BURK|nr:peptidylprolyl isomerase [Rubrivivax albus]RVT52520.1 molecular chaperone SurA [Rubrivivax albus]
MTRHSLLRQALAACAALSTLAPAAAQRVAEPRVVATPGDHIVAVVNQELVTAVELGRRQALIRQGALRAGQPVPPADALLAQALESLIEERVIVTHARDLGWRIDEAEIDRAVGSVAAQNQMTVAQLRERLQIEGLDMTRFRAQLRDQIAVERTREQEVIGRIVVSEEEVDRELAAEREASRANAEVNIAQILVAVPDGADGTALAERRLRAEQALSRVRAGEDFAAVARELSDDASRERGGELGLRPPERLPDLFVDAVRGLEVGQVAAALVRSGAGFHVLKLVDRQAQAADDAVVETRARHILLRTSPQASPEQAARRLRDLKRQIEGGERRFEDVAREVSEDGSAAAGGDLGWYGPGVMVPEFDEPASRLAPGEISEPVASRFGVHLIQVLERRRAAMAPAERREQVRNILRERKFQQAYQDWVDELRARAYVEVREPDLATARR